MNEKTLIVFQRLMKNGSISRESDGSVFGYAQEEDVRDELQQMERCWEFKIYRTAGRIYLIPNQENQIFLQGNREFKKVIGNDANKEDIYLVNYIALYLLNCLYGGKGENLQTRYFFRVSEFIAEFTQHCEQVKQEIEEFQSAGEKYSIAFTKLADKWLAKTGEEKNSFDTKYGCVMKVIRKFLIEDLLVETECETYKPTQKLNDIMPYFLSQERIADINAVLNIEIKEEPDKCRL